jgi:hypothetical protein
MQAAALMQSCSVTPAEGDAGEGEEAAAPAKTAEQEAAEVAQEGRELMQTG